MSSFMLKRWAGLAFGIAGVGAVAVPSLVSADQEAFFEAMDTDGDGKISMDEHAAAGGRMFEKMDANGDNKVTAAEMTAAHQKVTGKKPEKGEISSAEKIKMMDTNGDGILTVEEYAAGGHWIFEQMDTDHDSYLSKDEFKAGQKKFLHKPPPPSSSSSSSGSTRPAD